MGSQDQDGFTFTRQPSSYTNPPKNLNQMNPDSIHSMPSHNVNHLTPHSRYTMPPHHMNQFNPLIYQIDPTNGIYPANLDQHSTHKFYQDMLNTPISSPRSLHGVKTSKKSAKNSCNPDISPPLLAKKDWTIVEEEALTEAWLYISVDADVGNNQKNAAMWARVLDIWKEKMGPEHQTTRNNNSLQCHWFQIRSTVSKFVAKYEQLERHPQSGTNSDDLVVKALRLYEDFFGSPFKFLHCWKILVNNPKWCSKMLTKANASNKQDSINVPSETADESPHETISEEPLAPKGVNSDEIVRPQGRKNCKDKKRKLNEEKGVVDALNKLQSTLEKQVDVNQANLNMKDQVMKKEMELKEHVMKKEIELKEVAQKHRNEAHAMKMKEQRKRHIMNQDLSTLSPSLRASYEAMQAQILKDWENEILL